MSLQLLSRVTPRALVTALFVTLAVQASADVRFLEDLPGEFIDISLTGTSVVPTNDGEFDIVSTVGNALLPAGVVRIASNGGIRFGSTSIINGDLAPNNAALPSAGAFGGATALLPYWDDFVASNGLLVFGSIQHEERNGVLIIQWTNVKLEGAALQDRLTFQVQVPSTGGVLARFVYDDVLGAAGASATIGYQAATVADSAQHSFNAFHAVRNGMVLSLVDQPHNSFVDDVPGQFIDISATGTPLNLSGTQTVAVSTSVRNVVLTQGTLRVGVNGAIRVNGSSNILPGVNVPLPSGNVFGGSDALVPFWDDLETSGGATGTIFQQELADRHVIQWDAVGFTGSPVTERVTFQVQIFDRSPLIAQFIYQNVEGTRAARGASATIGYQGAFNPSVLQYSFNTPSVHNGSVLSLFGAVGVGTNYCVATNNSTGRPGRISARGNARVSNNNLFLDAFDLPQNAAAFFIVSRTPGFVPLAGGSQGNLCLVGNIGRGVGSIVNTGASGTAIGVANLQAMPSPTGPFAVQPGDTLSFQCWHRDAVGGTSTSNFTGALQIQFEP